MAKKKVAKQVAKKVVRKKASASDVPVREQRRVQEDAVLKARGGGGRKRPIYDDPI